MKFVREGKLPLKPEDIRSSRNGIGSTADSNSSVGLKYSTNLETQISGSDGSQRAIAPA